MGPFYLYVAVDKKSHQISWFWKDFQFVESSLRTPKIPLFFNKNDHESQENAQVTLIS